MMLLLQDICVSFRLLEFVKSEERRKISYRFGLSGYRLCNYPFLLVSPFTLADPKAEILQE